MKKEPCFSLLFFFWCSGSNMKKIMSVLYAIVMLAKNLGQKHRVILLPFTVVKTKVFCLFLQECRYGDSLPLFSDLPD